MFDRPLDCLATGEPDPDGTGGTVRMVYPVSAATWRARAEALGAGAWTVQTGFEAKPGEVVLLPGADGVAAALLGLGDEEPGPFAYAALPAYLPGGRWQIAGIEALSAAAEDAVLGFSLGAYHFDALRKVSDAPRPLLVDSGLGAGAAQARAVWLARDLINMPANRLGPRELAEAAVAVCLRFGAEAKIIEGEALALGYPAIEAVGRGSARRPQVLSARWMGSQAHASSPLLSLVGKGVCFDTGGYDLKPSAGMLRMKKDMGGAAIMLGLARLIMERDLPVRLQLRLGCVENSVSGEAMRPSDVIPTRKGLQVEIGNTDAEGRLVLCDLLAEACEHEPALLLDAATLTGAARVALGPDLPALFSNDDRVAGILLDAGLAAHDPLWRLPLHDGYDGWLSSSVADLNNVSLKPAAGAITAALFLRRFVTSNIAWAHIDTYAWSDSARPGRPEGGDAQGLRAVFSGLLPILNL